MTTKSILSMALPLVLFSSSALAGNSNVDRAQALFDEAHSYFDDENFAVACPKFEESKRLANGLGVTLYLAACEDAIGKRASALAYYREAEAVAHMRGDERERIAHQAVIDLDDKTARIRVHLPKASSTATVTDNGHLIVVDSRGFPADPGWHKIVVSDNGKKPWQENVHVPESTDDASPPTLDVTMQSVLTEAPKPPPAAQPSSPMTMRSPTSERGTTQKAIGVGVAAAGVVGLGLGTYFGVHAMSLRSQSNDPGGGCDANDQCNGRGQALRSNALDSATISTALFAVGGAAVVAGIVLYVATPSPRADVAVALGPTGASLRGSF